MSDIHSVFSEGVLEVVLDRPSAKNALNRAITDALGEILSTAAADDRIGAVLLSSASGVFAAGADVGEMLTLPIAEVLATDFAGCCAALGSFPKPVVVAVEGAALGGGAELVEMCDVVIAAETAVFGHPEITLGTMPGCGGTQRLPRALGRAKAMDLLLTGRSMRAEEAERCGLVSRLVPAGEALAEGRSSLGRSLLCQAKLPAG